MRTLKRMFNAQGVPCTLQEFNGYLLDLEQKLFNQGWAVIGSVFKESRLHKWKYVPRSTLHYDAQNDLRWMRANSLNLRLDDTNTIAFDCDFHYQKLMSEFTQAVCLFLGLKPSELYTCQGKKGGKLFFSFAPQNIKLIPRRIKAAYHWQGDQVMSVNPLEIKRDLSTIAGLHSVINDTFIIYGPYEDYGYIGEAAPSDLRHLTLSEFEAILAIYRQVATNLGLYGDACTLLASKFDRALIHSCLAHYLVNCMIQRPELSWDEAVLFASQNPYYETVIKPSLIAIGCKPLARAIEIVFRGDTFGAANPAILDAERLIKELIRRRDYQSLIAYSLPFEMHVKPYSGIFLARMSNEQYMRGLDLDFYARYALVNGVAYDIAVQNVHSANF